MIREFWLRRRISNQLPTTTFEAGIAAVVELRISRWPYKEVGE